MPQRFSASIRAVPVEDVGASAPRIIRQKVEVEIGDRALTIGALQAPYSSIRSAELHRFHSWPLTSYSLVVVVGDEVISIAVPSAIVRAGFPFPFVERDVSVHPERQRRAGWWVYAEVGLFVLVALLYLFRHRML